MKNKGVVIRVMICLAALAMVCASEVTSYAGYLIICCYALMGRAFAIQALFMSWLFSMISPGIAVDSSAGAIGRYLVLAAATCSVFLRSSAVRGHLHVSRLVMGTMLLGIFLIVHSCLFSPIKDVSLMKAISWTVAACTIFSAWAELSDAEHKALSGQIFGWLVAILALSLPLLPLSIGYLRNGTGFQGVLAHPQAFGPTMGMLGAWAGGHILADRKPKLHMMGLFGLCLVLIVMSEARTAGIALLLGIILAALAGGTLAGRSLRHFLPGLRSLRVYMIFALTAAIAVLASSALSDRVEQYLSKRGDSSNLVAAYDTSRGMLIARMWSNIESHPFSGIGFGIASRLEDMEVARDPVLGLPTGAAIEKGVLPVAVMEELGIYGFLAVTIWLYILIRRAARVGGMTALSVCFATLLMNMGESVLFSPGGMGLLSLILIGWAISERHESC